jgi:3-oxoadipate CoA-transferase, beta subunit
MRTFLNGLTPEEIAREVALELPDGSYVNLGIGMPQLVAGHVPSDRELVFHSENGVLGVGPRAAEGEEDWDLIDAGKVPVMLLSGGSYLSHSDSFALIRGGHLDFSVIGGLQVSAAGDLANWSTGEGIPGVGGAMDLARGAKRVYVLMRHTTKDGVPKIVPHCTLPLTGRRVVARVFTELGIFEPTGDSLLAHALARDVDLAEVQRCTAVPVRTIADVLELPRRP